MTREERWLKKRCGMITASELGQITSASGRIIDGIVSYIRSKRWERRHGFAHPVNARQMAIGVEQEPMAVAWLHQNVSPDILYAQDFAEIPFWISPDCPLGASPDAYLPDESVVYEIKTLVGANAIEFFDDPYTPETEKKYAVLKDHGEQIFGQFLSNPKVQEIKLLKYIYQDDDIMRDLDSPIAEWRGHLYSFKREDYAENISVMRDRIRLIDAMIDAPINPTEFKSGEWCLDEKGKLYQK